MKFYILKQLIKTIAMFFIITFIVFILLYILPGELDEIAFYMGDIDPEHYIYYKEVHGLDNSWYIQYYYFLKGFFTGDMGILFLSGEPTTDMILSKIPFTLLYETAVVCLSIVIGVPLCVIAAVKKKTKMSNLIKKGNNKNNIKKIERSMWKVCMKTYKG